MSDLELNSLPKKSDRLRPKDDSDRELEDLHEGMLDFPDPVLPLSDVEDLLREVDID